MEKPLILAVETSSRIGSVAIAVGGELLGQSTFSASLRHSAEIFPTITDLLGRFDYRSTDIDQIHLSIGPGSFTGLRIAVAAAKSMHLANSVQIVTVDSLDSIAANVKDDAVASMIQTNAISPVRLATVLDAKRGQFYAAVYECSATDASVQRACDAEDPGYQILASGNTCWQKILPDSLLTASELVERFARETAPLYLTGDGLLHHQDKFAADNIHLLEPAYWSPHAVQVHALGYQKACMQRFADPIALGPFYLRGPQVTLRKTAR